MGDCQMKQNEQVFRELNELSGSLTNLKKDLKVLGEGLSSVLRNPDPPCTTDCDTVDTDCALVGALAAYRQRVEELSLFVRDLTSRVEL